MPGSSYTGVLQPVTAEQQQLAHRLEEHAQVLAGDIGSRNALFRRKYGKAAAYIIEAFTEAGLDVKPHLFEFTLGGATDTAMNIVAEIQGSDRADEIVIIGAHYDTCSSSPGANDNGSGVAAVIELARRFSGAQQPRRTLRFVAFANEEPPCFQTDAMGSLAYARRCRANNEDITAMLAIETIGCYFDSPGSQQYPVAPLALVYPDRGDFITFVGNISSRRLVRDAIGTFREHAMFPSEGAALPGWIEGVGWSDHCAFWQCGYSAVMVTDTAPFRYPHYHTLADTPDKLDYTRMARIVDGLGQVVDALASEP